MFEYPKYCRLPEEGRLETMMQDELTSVPVCPMLLRPGITCDDCRWKQRDTSVADGSAVII